MKRTISNKAFLNIAASSLIVGMTMVGCSGAAMQGHPAIASAKGGKQAGIYAAKAEKALAKRDVSAALAAAEAAVAGQPDSAPYRTLLGRAYFADGRFASAETAFSDAMTLGNSDARTVISLALAKVALGKAPAARALLADNMDRLPAADYGLAIAMAGDAPEGVRILSRAAQEPTADAKTRQNFAYALALAGNWKDARLMAGQDMDPAAATQRIVGWAQTAEPGMEPQRVAALVGTNMRFDDAGMPARLALAAPVADAPVLAEAAPVAPAPVEDTVPAPVQVAVAAPAPILNVAIPASTVSTARVIKAPAKAARQPVLAAAPKFATDGKPVTRQVAMIKPVAGNAASPWVVQLGAYDSAGVAKDNWQRLTRLHRGLASYSVLNSNATVNGKSFYRLAVKGFSDRASADAMCRSIRAQKGQCFVRAGAPDAKPVNWAVTQKKQQIAMR